jgi:hypothetical protein
MPMNFDKYIQEGSPLRTAAKPETLRQILYGIAEEKQYPQDSITTQMIDEAMMEFPQIMPKSIQRFGFTPQDFNEIQAGYFQTLMAINVTLKARGESDNAALNYANGLFNDATERNYFKTHIHNLKERLVQDHTVADMFEYLANSPIKSRDFYRLGIELAKIKLTEYGFIVMSAMVQRFGGFQATMIWKGIG